MLAAMTRTLAPRTRRGGGDSQALPARGLVAKETDRVDGFARASGRDDDGPAGQNGGRLELACAVEDIQGAPRNLLGGRQTPHAAIT